jgi:tetratricopeptide (TPR) repeat protein
MDSPRDPSPPARISQSSELAKPLFGKPKPLVPPAPAGDATADAGRVVPALAWEEPGSGPPIVQTAGILDKPVGAVRQGVNKVSEAIAPTTPVTPPDDPTLLSTKTKATPELYLSLAQYQEELGKSAAAEQSYQQALRIAPKHLGAHLAYARFKERQGQTQEALQCYQKVARLLPNEAAVFNDMGLLYARHGMNNEALAAYSRAIELQPRRSLYRNNMAVLLVDLDRADQAMGHLTSVYPSADACYKLGYLLQKKGQTRQAMSMFSRALVLCPSMTEARLWLNHLEATAEGAAPAQVARRPADPRGTPERGEPPRDARLNDIPPAPPLPGDAGPSGEGRGTLRQLPPVTKPLPRPDREEIPAPAVNPGLGPRRLPATSSERPTAHEEPAETQSSGARRQTTPTNGLEEAPLPTSLPPGRR